MAEQPVTFLNPFPAGGGTDTLARPIAARLSQQVGQQFLIENQGGAGGTLGAANVTKRAPDGYNWFFGAVHHTIAESLYTRLPYSLEKDFEPITVAAFPIWHSGFAIHPPTALGRTNSPSLTTKAISAFDGMGTSSVQIKAGKLIPLAVTSAARNPVLPNVPTMAEAGLPGYEVRTWYGIWARPRKPRTACTRR